MTGTESPSRLLLCPPTWHMAGWHRQDSLALLLPTLPPWRLHCQFCQRPANGERQWLPHRVKDRKPCVSLVAL